MTMPDPATQPTSESGPLRVVDWLSWEAAQDCPENSLGGLGGWFSDGDRWDTYLGQLAPESIPYAEALRSSLIQDGIRAGGDWHQEEGTPLFSDGTVSTFTYRAWGDFCAAVWSTHDNKDYSYMDFYMTGWGAL